MACLAARSAIAAKSLATRATAPRPARASAVSVNAYAREFDGKWYPGAEPPSYLDGSMPGDFGFDPLRIGANEKNLPWFQEAELMNGRWAMAALVGQVVAEANGVDPYEAPFAEYSFLGTGVDGIVPLAAFQIAVMSALELSRIKMWEETGMIGLLGESPYDPAGLGAKDPDMAEKEIKHARLGMVAMIGVFSQKAVTGLGPVAALQAHFADPGGVNIYTSAVGNEVVLAIVALSVWPCFILANKSISGDKDGGFRPIPF